MHVKWPAWECSYKTRKSQLLLGPGSSVTLFWSAPSPKTRDENRTDFFHCGAGTRVGVLAVHVRVTSRLGIVFKLAFKLRRTPLRRNVWCENDPTRIGNQSKMDGWMAGWVDSG